MSITRFSRRIRRRIGTHLSLAVVSTALGLGIALALHSGSGARERFSIATAYVGMFWIVASLLVGPINLLRGRPNPVSVDLRRDMGIWGGFAGLVHLGVGLTVHMRGRMSEYFLPPAGTDGFFVRLDAFGVANHLGLVSGFVLAVLIVLSSDWALRSLGVVRWKRWQQWNYLCFGALVVHGSLYQLLEKRGLGLVMLFAMLTVAAVAFQLAGVRARVGAQSSAGTSAQSR